MTKSTPSRATFHRRGHPELPKVDPLQQTTAGMGVVSQWLEAVPDGGAGRQSRAEGQDARERPGRTGEAGEAGSTPQRASLEALLAVAVQQAPHWRSMTVRVPQRGATQLTVTLEEAKALHPYPRSILMLDAATRSREVGTLRQL